MKHFDLIIKNGRVVLPKAKDVTLGEQANLLKSSPLTIASTNIGIINGKIAEVGDLHRCSANETIDANHLHVLPGVIDSQVHFREPGLTHKEDLKTGTLSALTGGVTSIFEMPNTSPATTTQELFEQKLNLAKGRAYTNYAFYIGGSSANAHEIATLERLPGCSGTKVFVGSSTGNLLVEDDENIEKILSHGQRRVIFHSEDEYILRANKSIATDSKDVCRHHEWRNVESALSSTKRILALAEKTKRPVHILHVTTEEEMSLLTKHKNLATVEVLPQHLTLYAPDCYERLGTLAQQNPPIREKRHLEGLWRGLLDGTVTVLGSDHAPHTLEEKQRPYPTSPSGMPGVQTLLPIMLNYVNQNKLSLERFVELVGENPRWVFGCPTKGRIAIGLDADFSIVDLSKQWTITNSWIKSRAGWTPFDGYKVFGKPISSVVGGKLAIQDDEPLTEPSGQRINFL
jgi:dihydroorotase